MALLATYVLLLWFVHLALPLQRIGLGSEPTSQFLAIFTGLGMLGYPELLQLCPSIILLWVRWKYGKAVLRYCWRLICYCCGLFIWLYLCIGLVWAVSSSRDDCAHQGQQQRETVSHGGIQTWKHCKLHENRHIPRSTLGGSFFDRRLVAYVDTGNKANTATPREAFQVLYPDGRGAVQRKTLRIQGFTGALSTSLMVSLVPTKSRCESPLMQLSSIANTNIAS